ncbi:hypothetical protein SADUNF_Sadunf12G0032800 [Salix dunnii]|uniref:Uncharacterized protein n=1 Tax=Salix dunnii TaxID=1413687 RepID=A0A835JMK6_9ROSI|nr:hypothetical protein SADUNF_Sadunf12G0032800 [Salix dunnii]
MPLDIGNLRSLESLPLHKNFLTGSSTPQYSTGKISNLRVVHGNEKSPRRLASSFGRMSQLQDLTLAAVFPWGTTPISLANCTQLEVLKLSNNHVVGAITEKPDRKNEGKLK